MQDWNHSIKWCTFDRENQAELIDPFSLCLLPKQFSFYSSQLSHNLDNQNERKNKLTIHPSHTTAHNDVQTFHLVSLPDQHYTPFFRRMH
jgi:hypothetical protein